MFGTGCAWLVPVARNPVTAGEDDSNHRHDSEDVQREAQSSEQEGRNDERD